MNATVAARSLSGAFTRFASAAKSSASSHAGLWVVLGFAAATRIALYLVARPWDADILAREIMTGDANTYHALAAGILDRVPYSEAEGEFAQRPPVYPLFLSTVYVIFGRNAWAALAVQGLINISTVAIVYAIALTLFRSYRAALVGAVLFTLSLVPAWIAVHALLTETLFTAVMGLAILAFLRGLSSHSFRWLLLSGVLFGIATLTRPVLQYFVVVPALVVLVGGGSMRTRLALISALLLAFAAAIAPWQLRNLSSFGHYSVSTMGGDMVFKFAFTAKSRAEGIDGYVARDQLGWQEFKDVQNPFDRSAEGKRRGARYLFDNPSMFARLYTRGLLSMFATTEKGIILYELLRRELLHEIPLYTESVPQRIGRIVGDLRTELFLTPVLLLRLLVVYALFATGLGVLVRQGHWHVAAFFLLTVAYFVLVTGQLGVGLRYRVPLIPLYSAVGSAGALAAWYSGKAILTSDARVRRALRLGPGP